MAKAKETPRRTLRCYLCGQSMEVSARAMSTTCPGCHKAIVIEDVIVKSYVPVVDLQTCGTIHVTKKGRVVAQRIRCGCGIVCEGTIEGSIETDGDVEFGPKASWKGKQLCSRALEIKPGARLDGDVVVPWIRPEPERIVRPVRSPAGTAASRTAATSTRTSTPRKAPARKAATTGSATKKTAAKTTKKTTKTAEETAARTAKKVATKKPAAKKTTAKTTAKKTTSTATRSAAASRSQK